MKNVVRFLIVAMTGLVMTASAFAQATLGKEGGKAMSVFAEDEKLIEEILANDKELQKARETMSMLRQLYKDAGGKKKDKKATDSTTATSTTPPAPASSQVAGSSQTLTGVPSRHRILEQFRIITDKRRIADEKRIELLVVKSTRSWRTAEQRAALDVLAAEGRAVRDRRYNVIRKKIRTMRLRYWLDVHDAKLEEKARASAKSKLKQHQAAHCRVLRVTFPKQVDRWYEGVLAFGSKLETVEKNQLQSVFTPESGIEELNACGVTQGFGKSATKES